MKEEVDSPVLELFIVSAVYWGGILIVFLWLGRRITALKRQLVELKGEGRQDED